MLIVFDSMGGNVRRFVKKLNMPSIQVTEGLLVQEPFCLVTYTIRFGEVPDTTRDFLASNAKYMVGVASSGNINWGIERFARAAALISSQYHVPVLHQFELSGTAHDVEVFLQEVDKIVHSDSPMDQAQ